MKVSTLIKHLLRKILERGDFDVQNEFLATFSDDNRDSWYVTTRDIAEQGMDDFVVWLKTKSKKTKASTVPDTPS